MVFQSRTEHNIPVLMPEGRFDAYQTTSVDEWFIEVMQNHRFIVADLSAVTFMDTRAIATLVKWMKKTREQGGDLKLCNMRNAVRVIIELSKLDRAFAIFGSLEEALDACEAGQTNHIVDEEKQAPQKEHSMSENRIPEDVEVIQLENRIDAFRVAELQKNFEKLIEGGKRRFVVDLSHVDFLDSAGLALLVKLLKQAKSKDGNVVLVRSEKEAANRILKLTQFDKVFSISDSVELALRVLLS
jgi:anti-sigma B factor antagonist